MDFDVEYKKYNLTIRSEYVQENQQTSGADLTKHGFNAEAAYRVNRSISDLEEFMGIKQT